MPVIMDVVDYFANKRRVLVVWCVSTFVLLRVTTADAWCRVVVSEVPLWVSSLPDASHVMNALCILIRASQTAVRHWKCCDVTLSGQGSFYNEKLGLFAMRQVLLFYSKPCIVLLGVKLLRFIQTTDKLDSKKLELKQQPIQETHLFVGPCYLLDGMWRHFLGISLYPIFSCSKYSSK